jgi:ribosomal-protein-alanine N-acetyltransferase
MDSSIAPLPSLATEPLIRPISGPDEALVCARLMAASEPWVTLGRDVATSLRVIQDPTREVYVAQLGEEIAGFLILCLIGPFVGYLQTMCVAPGWRGRGMGTRFITFAEERIFREFANVFLCVSSFNTEAKRLYLRLGYVEIGEFKDYIVPGYSEILLRKTRGAIRDYQPG